MKTIAYAMGEHRIYKDIRPIILRGLEIITKDILHNLALKYAMTEHGIEELEKNFEQKIERLAEIDKNTIYFDGIKKIEDEMRKILERYPESRVVVFVDDLDRCSPEAALEVFESLKVFLDIEGFVFIIGLSRAVMDKLILKKFKEFDIDPEEYIRKVIQIEIRIAKWHKFAIKKLIKALLEELDKNSQAKLFGQDEADNRYLIEMVLSEGKSSKLLNPRQIKQSLIFLECFSQA